MKFETKFGIGEIVHYTLLGHPAAKHDELLEVVCISFGKGSMTYHCRYPKGNVGCFEECELIGDDDFNQETGKYDYDIKGQDD